MTKAPSKSRRTDPLDRDGDGHPGGSLPGNQTAPMADLLGDPNRPDDGPLNSEATPPADEAETVAAIVAGDETVPPADTPDEQTTQDRIQREVEKIEEAMRAPQQTALDAVAEAEPDLIATTLQDQADAVDDATFSAEEIAAGETPLIQEDEFEVTAAEAATVIDPEDPVVQVETDTAPVAVRLRELERLVANRWLYKDAGGYTPNYHPPYVDQATIDVWVGAGLARQDDSAGRIGGVRVTAQGRSVLTRGLRGVA